MVEASPKPDDRALSDDGCSFLGPRPLNPQARSLVVGGVTPLTTIDFPGELAAVVYCQGCPWRCRYCHNGHLLTRDQTDAIAWPTVWEFLRRRRGLLDGVVFSGGEPTLQPGLSGAIASVRALGFKVGLHSAGCYPQRLRPLLSQLDWVGLDIKALPQDYPALTGVPGSDKRAFASLDLLLASGVSYEIRITVHSDWLPEDKLDRLITLLHQRGAKNIMLQRCHVERALDSELGPHLAGWSDGTERRPAP